MNSVYYDEIWLNSNPTPGVLRVPATLAFVANLPNFGSTLQIANKNNNMGKNLPVIDELLRARN